MLKVPFSNDQERGWFSHAKDPVIFCVPFLASRSGIKANRPVPESGDLPSSLVRQRFAGNRVPVFGATP
jgi:hypothetical protein